MTSNLKPQKNPIRLTTKADHHRIKALGNSPIQKRALKISQKPSLPNKLDKDLYLSDVTKTHASRSKTGDTKKRNKDNPDKIDQQSKKKPVLKPSNGLSKIKPDVTDRNSIPSGTRKNYSPKKIDLDNAKPCKKFTEKSLSISRSVSASNSFGKGRKPKKLTDNIVKQKRLDIDSTSKRPKQTSEAKDQNVNIKGKTRPSKADQQDKHADSKRFKYIGSDRLLDRNSQPHSTKAQPKTHIDRPKVKGNRQQQANQKYPSTADDRSKHQAPLKDRAESRSRYSHTYGLHEDSEDKAFSLKPLSDSSESDQKDNGLNESRSSKGYPMPDSDYSSRRPATDRRSVTFSDNMRSNPPSEIGRRERSSPRFKDQAIEDVDHIRRNRPSKENDMRLKHFYKSQTQSGPYTGRKCTDFIQSSSSHRESQHSNDRQSRKQKFKKQHEDIANKRVQSLDSKDSYINESRSRGEMRVSDNMKNILHNNNLRRNRDPHTLNDIHSDQLHEAVLNNLQGPTFGDLRHSRLADTRPLTSSNFQIYEQFPSVQNYSRLVDKAIQAMEPYRNSNINDAVHGRSQEKFCQTDSLAEVSPPLTFQQLPSQHLLSRTASPSATGIKSSQRRASVSEEEMGSTVRLALEGWQQDKDRLAKAEDAIRELQAESRGLADELEQRRTREDSLIQAVKELEEILEEKDEAQKCFSQELDQRENLIQKLTEKLELSHNLLLESKEIESNLKEELEQVISSRNQRSEKNQYRSDNNEVNANKGNKFNIPIGNSSLGYNLNFGSSLACKTNQLSSRRNPEYEIPKNSDRTNELAFSVSSPSFGARFKYASKKQEKENLINVDIADGGLSGSSSGYRYSRGKQDYRSNDDAMARLRSQLATLPQTGGVSKFSASLYPPFTHKTEKRRVDIDDVIHEGTKGKNSSDKIFGYVDYRYLEEQNDALEPSRRGLETIYGGSDTLINKTKSNKKLYCEFAKTALNLMSVLEEGNNLVQKDDWANVPRDTELEDQVLEIKSKYCCTEP